MAAALKDSYGPEAPAVVDDMLGRLDDPSPVLPLLDALRDARAGTCAGR